jgi:two-component system, chemotaxis family, response regulator Rcp1
LIDDSPSDMRLFKEVLRDWETPHCFSWVEDGIEGLEFLHRSGNYAGAPKPDLIVLDINMPRLNGFDFLRSMRSDPELPHIPVIVLSCSNATLDVSRAYELSANCFIRKPTDLDSFSTVMAQIERFWFQTATLPPPELPPICVTNQPQNMDT